MSSFVDIQLIDFIDSVDDSTKSREAFIRADAQAVNCAHVKYNHDSNTIVIDSRYEFPATCNNIPSIRRAVYRALMY